MNPSTSKTPNFDAVNSCPRGEKFDAQKPTRKGRGEEVWFGRTRMIYHKGARLKKTLGRETRARGSRKRLVGRLTVGNLYPRKCHQWGRWGRRLKQIALGNLFYVHEKVPLPNKGVSNSRHLLGVREWGGHSQKKAKPDGNKSCHVHGRGSSSGKKEQASPGLRAAPTLNVVRAFIGYKWGGRGLLFVKNHH